MLPVNWPINSPMPLSIAPCSVIIITGCNKARTVSGVRCASSWPTNSASSPYRASKGRWLPRIALMTSSGVSAASKPAIMFWPYCSACIAAPCSTCPTASAARGSKPCGGIICGAAIGAGGIPCGGIIGPISGAIGPPACRNNGL